MSTTDMRGSAGLPSVAGPSTTAPETTGTAAAVGAAGFSPGVYDMPDAEYHGIKWALSCSGAKLLLPPSCPAIFRYRQDHPPKPKPHYDLGHAAHKAVLGVGAEIRYISSVDAKGNPSAGWATKDAQAQRTKAYADGAIPILEEDRWIVEGMAAKIRDHPIASALFNPNNGKPEQSLFAEDPRTGLPLRGRLDWLPNATPGRRMIIGDYKSATTAEPGAISRAMANYGYFQQDAFYSALVRTLGLDEDPAFVFVFQETEPPWVVTVAELDEDAKQIGRGLNARAIDTFIDCMTADTWPAYAADVIRVSLPKYFTYQHEDLL